MSSASSGLSRRRPPAATSSTSVHYRRHLSSRPKSLSRSGSPRPKSEIRRHGGFRRTKRHGTPLSCIKAGGRRGGAAPRRNSPEGRPGSSGCLVEVEVARRLLLEPEPVVLRGVLKEVGRVLEDVLVPGVGIRQEHIVVLLLELLVV